MMTDPAQTVPIRPPSSGQISVSPIDCDDVWNTEVLGCRDHSVFHRSEWTRVLTETYGHRSLFLKAGLDAATVALIPLLEVRSKITGRRAVSLPFSDFAGILWKAPQFADAVYRSLEVMAAKEGWDHLEIRGGRVGPADAQPYRSYEAHQLDLTIGPAALEQGLDSSTRRAIRKAERSGLEIRIETTDQALYAYYRLHGMTRRRHGLPPQPLGFFESIHRHLICQGLGELVMAYHGDMAVAGAVFLHSGDQAIYKFGASDPDYWSFRPNQLVMWSAIRHLTESGCRSLHFGRTSAGDSGLLRFKRSWGSFGHSLSYFRYQTESRSWVSTAGPPAESHPLFFGHFPLAINRLAGRLIYPHLD